MAIAVRAVEAWLSNGDGSAVSRPLITQYAPGERPTKFSGAGAGKGEEGEGEGGAGAARAAGAACASAGGAKWGEGPGIS